MYIYSTANFDLKKKYRKERRSRKITATINHRHLGFNDVKKMRLRIREKIKIMLRIAGNKLKKQNKEFGRYLGSIIY